MPALVVQTSFIGDVILTTPLIAHLAATDVVDVITTPAGADVLANNPDIRTLLVYDKHRDATRGFRRTAAAARRNATAPHRGPRRAYLAQGSVRSALLARAAGYTERTGFSTSSGRIGYTHRVPYRDDWHHARRLLSLADPEFAAQAPAAAVRPRLYLDSSAVNAVDLLTMGSARPFIALAPGSVWATKRWPFYAELATRLADEFDLALVGSAEDAEIAGAIVRAVGRDRVVDATGTLSILGSAELIRRAAAIVTNDSAPQHLASAVGTPTVAIFGPTVPSFGFGPLAARARVVGHDALACRPCDRHGPRRCPLGHWKCMREVTVTEVHDALRAVLQQHTTTESTSEGATA